MATATQEPGNAEVSEVERHVTNQLETYVVLVEKDKDGKEYYNYRSESDAEKVLKDPKSGAVEQFRQTVSFPRAKDFEGIRLICPNEAEAAANFNRGAKSKAINRLKAMLLETDEDGKLAFSPQEGAFDLTEEVASESQRRGLTPDEKYERFLETFSAPDAVKEAMRTAYYAAKRDTVAA